MRIYSLIFILTLFSCSAKYHYGKALKKGLEVIKTQDTIRITTLDSIPIIHHDTIVYEHFFSSKDTVIIYDNIYVPKTRLETRIEYKIIRDTIRQTKVIEKAKAKASKQPNYLLWVFLIVLVLIGSIFIKKLL